MARITITIDVPDGATVGVNNSGGSKRPFTPRPDPAKPQGFCPEHDTEWRLVPSGVSKRTGKPYNAFWACPERGCNEKPPSNADYVDEIPSDEPALPF